jgi:hypothetical protein
MGHSRPQIGTWGSLAAEGLWGWQAAGSSAARDTVTSRCMDALAAGEVTTWPTVVSAIASAVAAGAAAVSAFFAWRSSTKSAESAEDARRALAMLMFPRVMHMVWHQVVDADDKTTPVNRWNLVVWNASGWDAVDVEAEVQLRDGQRFGGNVSRLAPSSTGATAPEREDDRLVVDIPDMPEDTNAGYARVVRTVARWSDAQRIARWEARRDWNGKYAPPFADVVRQISGPSITIA